MSDNPKAECQACGKLVRVVIPKGGDGSAYVYWRHNDYKGLRCPESRMIVDEDRYTIQ